MKMTLRTEYALVALIYIARHQEEGCVSVETVARARDISPKFLEQIVGALKRGRYLRSYKGKKGGYRLAKPADKITLAEIIRFFDGALAPTESVSKYFYESTPIEGEKGLVSVFRDIRDYVARKLESTTLADVAK